MMVYRPALITFLLTLATLASSGCGNYETRLPNYYNYVPSIGAKMQQNPGPVPVPHVDNALTAQHDPLADIHDPLLGAGGKTTDPNIPDSDSDLQGVNNGGPRSCYGRYWVNGNINSGEVEIDVNGMSIGTFTSHVDQEITRWCHKGGNSITFVHHPAPGFTVCAAHLQVFDGLRTASPLEFTYDTTAQATEEQSTMQRLSAPTTDSNGQILQPSLPAPGSVDLSDPSSLSKSVGTTDERMFNDDITSLGKPAGST